MVVLHSALKPELDVPELDRFEGKHGVSFAYDLGKEQAITSDYSPVDVYYIEPPFPAGWKLFHDRVGSAPAMTYKEFMQVCTKPMLFRPGCVMTSPVVKLGGGHPVTEHDLHDLTKTGRASVHWFGIEPPAEPLPNLLDVITHLATRFECVGDFCCGYGIAGKVFSEAGKRYVMSDINPRCVGYISQQEWA